MGIKSARGEWILFLDSDDRWLSQKHELQWMAITAKPNAVASVTGLQNQRDGRLSVSLPPSSIRLDDLRRKNFLGTTSSAMARRSSLLAVGCFDEDLPSCQDWDLWLKLARIGEFAIVAEPLVVYEDGSLDRISRNKGAVLAGHATVFSRALSGVDEDRRQIEAYHRARLAELYLYNFNDPMGATVEAVKSFRTAITFAGLHVLVWSLLLGMRNLASSARDRMRMLS